MAQPFLYSERFIGEPGITSGFAFIVPDGFRAVVRCVDLYNGGGLGAGQVYVSGNAGQTFYTKHWDNDIGESSQWQGRQVLYPGEALTVRADLPTDVTVSGYLLVAP